ncbi:MAG: hypothetical protein AAF152_05245 [Cyanobacteria bacterium P01_A01_bin.114]
MSTKTQARALMVRHHQLIKQRQQSLLTRAAAQVGLEAGEIGPGSRIQGKHSNAQLGYVRGHAALS